MKYHIWLTNSHITYFFHAWFSSIMGWMIIGLIALVPISIMLSPVFMFFSFAEKVHEHIQNPLGDPDDHCNSNYYSEATRKAWKCK